MRPPHVISLLAATSAAALLALAPAATGQSDRKPEFKILGPQGKLNFEIRPREACDKFVLADVRLRFKGHGVTRTYTLDDPCGDWQGSEKGIPSVRFRTEDGTEKMAARLRGRAVGDKEVKRSYAFTIHIDGKLAEKGTMKVDVRREDDEIERYLYIKD